jgi:hypothetical protein
VCLGGAGAGACEWLDWEQLEELFEAVRVCGIAGGARNWGTQVALLRQDFMFRESVQERLGSL